MGDSERMAALPLWRVMIHSMRPGSSVVARMERKRSGSGVPAFGFAQCGLQVRWLRARDNWRCIAGAAMVLVRIPGSEGENMSAGVETVLRQKGPRVWLDMDQKELDDAYDQAVYAPNSEQV